MGDEMLCGFMEIDLSHEREVRVTINSSSSSEWVTISWNIKPLCGYLKEGLEGALIAYSEMPWEKAQMCADWLNEWVDAYMYTSGVILLTALDALMAHMQEERRKRAELMRELSTKEVSE